MSSRYRSFAGNPMAFAAALVVALFMVNLIVTPSFVSSSQLPSTVDLAVPAMLAALASAPAILGGGGGFDISVGPALGFVNVFLVSVLLPHGLGSCWIAIPLCLLVGTGLGVINGGVVTLLRLPAVVVTLGSYLVLSGLALVLLPIAGGRAPGWVNYLSNGWGPVPRSLILLVVAMIIWQTAKRVGYIGLLRAVGSDDRAAYTAGVNIVAVRWLSYALDGLLAGLAGIALTVLIGSGDPNQGTQYTLISVAAVALGGNALTGGAGNMVGPLLGSLVIFLLQNLLAATHVSSNWIQISYGGVLLAAVMVNAAFRKVLIAPGTGVHA